MTPQREYPQKPFVFLSVDVIEHTERLRSAWTESNYDFRELDDVLNRLRDAIEGAIPGFKRSMRWDWAGDGGIYAFLAETETVALARAIEAGERIVAALPAFNDTHNLEPIRVRIAIDYGPALVKPERAFCRSLALNVAAKLKVPDDSDSISITNRIHNEIKKNNALAAKFVPLPWMTDETRDPRATIVYGHAGLIRRALMAKRDQHLAAGQSLFAAHCEFRRFCVGLASLPPLLDEAREAIRSASSLAEAETARGRYFVRAMASFYAAWEEVVAQASLAAEIGGDRLRFIVEQESRLVELLGSERYRLLRDVEYAIEQMDLFATLFLNGPASVVTLEMNAFLLRAGYSPLYANRAVARKTAADYRELQDSQWRLHGGCSLCTAVVASALALSGMPLSEFGASTAWLASLEADGFAHHDANYAGIRTEEHGKHYAAHVLQAFLDAGVPEERVRALVDVFFPPFAASAGQVFEHWMKWRSGGVFDVGLQIFTALLALERSPHRGLLDPHRALLREVCDRYVELIRKDAAEAEIDPPTALHSFRKNLAAFTLGRLLGSESCATALDDVSKTLTRIVVRAVDVHHEEARKHGYLRRRYLLSSRIDHVVIVLEGWLAAFDATIEAR